MEPPDPLSIASLRRFGEWMEGKTLERVLHERGLHHRLPEVEAGKGGVGNMVQLAFGLEADSRPEADFPDATEDGIVVPGVELKIVPLKKTGKGWRVKERQMICMIDYDGIVDEDWRASHAMSKLNRILNVFITHQENRSDSLILGSGIWTPADSIEPILSLDWHRCKSMVTNGSAHELSERLFSTLSPARKGAGGKEKPRVYRTGSVPAMKRAFSLKVGYMQGVWSERRHRRTAEKVAVDSTVEEPGERILCRLDSIRGMTVGELLQKMRMPMPRAKDFFSRVVRTWLTDGVHSKRIIELEDAGILLKTVPVNSITGQPFEATSFPAIEIAQLIETEFFEDDPLSEMLDRIIFLPGLRPKRDTDRWDIRVGEAIDWRPSDSEWRTIESEWRRFRDVLREPNGVDRLPHESDTRIIHMRPKARDSTVRDAGTWGDITRQCFWLNRDFVDSLLRR